MTIAVDPDHAPREAPPLVWEIRAVQRMGAMGAMFVKVLVWEADDDDGPDVEHVTDDVHGPLFDERPGMVGRRVMPVAGRLDITPWPSGRRFVFLSSAGVVPWSAIRGALAPTEVKESVAVPV